MVQGSCKVHQPGDFRQRHARDHQHLEEFCKPSPHLVGVFLPNTAHAQTQSFVLRSKMQAAESQRPSMVQVFTVFQNVLGKVGVA